MIVTKRQNKNGQIVGAMYTGGGLCSTLSTAYGLLPAYTYITSKHIQIYRQIQIQIHKYANTQTHKYTCSASLVFTFSITTHHINSAVSTFKYANNKWGIIYQQKSSLLVSMSCFYQTHTLHLNTSKYKSTDKYK